MKKLLEHFRGIFIIPVRPEEETNPDYIERQECRARLWYRFRYTHDTLPYNRYY